MTSANPVTGSPIGRLVAAVARLQAKLNRADRATANALEVGSAEDLQVLHLLHSDGPLRVGELARQRASSVTTASGRLDRLERRGLIGRTRIPGDRRAMVVELTERGTKAAMASCELRLASLQSIASDFPIDDLDELIEVISDGLTELDHERGASE